MTEETETDLDSLIALQAVVSRGRMQRISLYNLEALCEVADGLDLDLAELVRRYREFEV